MSLSLAYVTNRVDCKVEWFLDSLARQEGITFPNPIIIVDFFKDQRDMSNGVWKTIYEQPRITHVAPKPSVWSGPHRLTKDNWFSASSFRTTALCYCRTEWLAYCDDLSVLMPSWLNSVREAMAGNYIALGAYKKVKEIRENDGSVMSWIEFPGGIDSRWSYGSDSEPVPANGGMMYGCSVAMPVEALLTINGWPEDLCDGLGSEDYCCGLALQNAGYTFKYDRRMLTLESEEDHHKEKPFRKDDWHMENGIPVRGGNGGDDKSHAALNIAKQSKYFPNSFGEGGIRALRQRILAGGSFPIPTTPDRDWYTGQLLSEL